MKRTTLIVAVLLAVFIMQSCKKSSDDATSTNTTTPILQAYINDTSWTPIAYNASVAYTVASKTKVFSCTGVVGTQQLNFVVTQKNVGPGSGFPISTFTADTSSHVLLSYAIENSSNVFVPQGTVRSGSVVVTAVDSVNMVITGSFSFNTIKYSYDINGNITSLFVNDINSGTFNGMPYTYKKQ